MFKIIGGLPPLVPTRDWTNSKLDKPKHWEACEMEIEGRPDLKLKAWSVKKIPKILDDIVEYTDEEYDLHLKDPNWTKQDTDQLFNLCRNYNLAFFIIHDRYESEVPRTIEDLKHRYYQVTRILMSLRLPREDPTTREKISSFSFDKQLEEQRKKNLEILYSRTAEQVQEEQLLFGELCRFEQADKWNKQRDGLLKIFGNHEIPMSVMTGTLERASEKKRRKHPSFDLSRQRKARDFEDLTVRRERIPAGIHARTTRIAPLKPSLAPKVVQILEELGVGLKPRMPTENVCAKFEELRTLVQANVEIKKYIERLEQEKNLKRKGMKRSSSISGSISMTPKDQKKFRP